MTTLAQDIAAAIDQRATVYYSGDYSSIQAAIDAALGDNGYVEGTTILKARQPAKVLIVQPGAYALTAPARITSAQGLRIVFDHVTLIAAADMPAIIDMTGCGYCTLGGQFFTLDTTSDVIVDEMISIENDFDVAERGTTRNTLDGVFIKGRFKTGLHIGRQLDNKQCDQTFIRNVKITGSWTDGEMTLWQRAFHLGSGVFGNNLLHRLQDYSAVKVKVGVFVDDTSAYVQNGEMGYNGTNFVVASTAPFVAEFIRAEHSQRFISTPREDLGSGGTTWGSPITIRGAEYSCTDIAEDGIALNLAAAGNVTLDNFRFKEYGAPRAPKIRALPNKPLDIDLHHVYVTSGVAPTASPALFERNEQVRVCGELCEITDQGGMIAIYDINVERG